VNKLEQELMHSERDRESLSLRLEDRGKTAEIFEDISKMYDTFIEKIDFDSLIEKIGGFVDRILTPDLLIVRIFFPEIVDKKIVVGEDKIEIPTEITDVLLTQKEHIDIEDVTHYPPYNQLKKKGLNKIIACPLYTKENTYGFIAGFNRDRSFTNTQQFLFTNLAHHIALLIENAQLLEKIKTIAVKRGKEGILDLKRLEEEISVEKKVEEREMELAREIQKKLLPLPLPKIPGVEIQALSKASFEVGGDFFDIFPLPGKKLGIVIADVSGKGVPASLVMVMLRTALKTLSNSIKQSPLRCVKNINRYIYAETEEHIFVSLSYLILYLEEWKLLFINAGGESPLIFRNQTKKVEELEADGIVVGLLPNWKEGRVKEVKFKKGDLLFLYTDGVIEVSNPQAEVYGEKRLQNFLKRKGSLPPGGFLKELEMEIMGFSGNQPLSDDLTLLALKKK